MKDYIYLDTSFLHSLLAQSQDGLVSNTSSEIQESRTETSIENKTREKSTEGLAGVRLGVQATAKLTAKEAYGDSVSLSQLEAGKEIISRQLHDNAVDQFILHLDDSGQLSRGDEIGINEYVLYTSTFKMIDIEYLEILTDKRFQNLFFTPQEKKKNSLPPELKKMLEFLSLTLPTKIFLKQNKFLSLLKKEHFRATSKELLLKYSPSSQITLLGKTTRKIVSEPDTNPDFTSLADISNLISITTDTTLLTTGIVSIGDTLVTPIAIFFESV